MNNKPMYIRLLALLMAFILMVTAVPFAVFAESEDTADDQPGTQTDFVVIDDDEEEDAFESSGPSSGEYPKEPPVVEKQPDEVIKDEPTNELDMPMEEEQPEPPVMNDPDEDIQTDDDLPVVDNDPFDPEQEEPIPDEPIEEEQPIDVTPPDEEDEMEDPIVEPDEEIDEDFAFTEIERTINHQGYAYVTVDHSAMVYADPYMEVPVFCVTQQYGVLLATDYVEHGDYRLLSVWMLTDDFRVIAGYVSEDDVHPSVLPYDSALELTESLWCALVPMDAGDLYIFAVNGYFIDTVIKVPVVDEPQQPEEMDDPYSRTPEVSDDAYEEIPVQPDIDVEKTIIPDESIIDDIEDDEYIEPMLGYFHVGDFVAVTTNTRAFLGIDESASDEYEGSLCVGYFVKDAVVQIEYIEQDCQDRYWFCIRYMYGDDFADGTLKWTEFGSMYVLADETILSISNEFTVTDYAFRAKLRSRGVMMLAATPTNGFKLKNISVSLPSLYVGQTDLYGSSGKDSDYDQIATAYGHGAVYATPHYLDGYTVYCLEHTLPGPGENKSGGGTQPKGPYVIVDIDSYMNTPGYSGVIYHESTIHAIAWVLRHTYPFMALDRTDKDNLVWSRVAGQFAIREVIKQLEGSQYVRDYWDMSNFYRASGQAPEVYLNYARWLAENGIARASITGNISVTNKSITSAGGSYIGTATLSTDADYIRIPKSAAVITGNTARADDSYYYLNSGDTITVTSSSNRFGITAESVSSDVEEANFLIGVPSVAIQKVLIPQYGAPYELKSVYLDFDVEYGSIIVTKQGAETSNKLSGATFELLNSAGTVLQTQTTGSSGMVMFSNLEPGAYTVRETRAPSGYTIAESSTQNVTVATGQTAQLTFTNSQITGKIRIMKADALTKAPLACAEFTITRLSGPAGDNGAGVGTTIKITTDASGFAETDWLPYGKYKVEETAAPDTYINSGFSTTVEAYENGKVYTLAVENEPSMGFIRIVKTDSMIGKPLAGVRFDIFTASGTLAGTMTTNDKGVAVSGPLTKGSYTVKEHAHPSGYVGTLYTGDAEVTPAEVFDLTAENEISQSKIRITKSDALTGVPLANVEFTITRLSAPEALDGAGIGQTVKITTGTDGTAITDWLPYGRYRIAETKAPAHYVDSKFTTEVDCFEDGKTYEIAVTNEPTKGQIKLTKTEADVHYPLYGVQFDIYDAAGNLVCTMTTDKNGVAVSEALPKGTYTVKERALPEGYVGELSTMDAVVDPDDVTELTVENHEAHSKIRIMKTDALTHEPVAGVEFTITRLSGPDAASGYGHGAAITITTDDSGTAITGWLPWGCYQVAESKVPEHYVDAKYTTEINAFEDGKTYEIAVTNEPTKGYIKLTKTDGQTGAVMFGVQFDIYDADGTLVGTMTTDSKGVAMSGALNKGGYLVKEHALPDGYAGTLVTLDAVVRSDETTELNCVNTMAQSKIRIKKIDELSRAPLAGATFTITRLSVPDIAGSSGVGDVVTITTDENGLAITDWLPYGRYRIEETVVPLHYVDNHYVTEIDAVEDGKIYEIEVENEPTVGWIKLTKTDSLDHTPIGGVTFDIYHKDDLSAPVASITTSKDGTATSEPLIKGEYVVREHAMPTGYVTNLLFIDAVVEPDKTTELTAENQPIQGKIRIIKSDGLTKAPLSGAEFTITRISGLPSHNGSGNGEIVAILTTDADGLVESPMLIYGTYRVDETKVPEHYVDNGFTATVVIDKEDQLIYEVPCENEPTKGWIRLVKTDSLDHTPIADVTFSIFYNDEYGTGLAATMTTDEHGIAVSPALRKGKYLVKEDADPTGYAAELAEVDAIVKSDLTTDLSVTNKPIQGKIRIVKTDELTKEALAGAVFTITRISGVPSHHGNNDDEVVATITTDAYGLAVSPLLTWGTYRIDETTVPIHYVDNDFTTTVSIDQDDLQTYTVDVENEPTKGWLKIIKMDRLTGNPISGVRFEVYYNDQYGGSLATTIATDQDGIALTEPLRKGQYLVKEVGETPGYVFEEITLNMTVKSDEITEQHVTNQPVLTKLCLYKRDEDEYTDNPVDAPTTRGDGILTGAVFQVIAGKDIKDRQGHVIHAKGDVVAEQLITACDEACVLSDEMWPGVYEIVELTPPTGYQPSTMHITVDTTAAAKQSKEAVVIYDGVKTNEIMYGAIAIVKVLGDPNEETNPERVEKPESKAEFDVFLKSAGSYANARSFERDHIITNKNGYAMSKKLPFGIYTIQQTKGKDGYEIKGPIDVEINGTENLKNPPIVTLSDKPIKYRLRLIKIDAKTGNIITLSNASFKLRDEEGNLVTQKLYYPVEKEIDTFTTDESGTVELPEAITWGMYTIEEVKAPEGYLILTEGFSVFVGRADDQPGETYVLDIRIPDEPVKGCIMLDKMGLQLVGTETITSEDGFVYHQPIYENRYLAGAVFQVVAAEDIIGKDETVWYHTGDVVDSIVTSGNGSDQSKELPLGKYVVIETTAPNGYVFDVTEYPAELTYADDHTARVETRVTVGNNYLPIEVTLTKTKDELQLVSDDTATIRQIITTVPGEGFVFGLYLNEDVPYIGGKIMADTLMAVGKTDADGKLTFSGYYPHGSYSIKELKGQDGWRLCADRFDVLLDADPHAADLPVVRAILPDAVYNELIHGYVTLTKTDLTGENTVTGALIEVRNSNDEVIYRAYTDDHGEIPDIPVTPGVYTFREILAPEGYELNDAVMTFMVDEDGAVTGNTIIRDDYTRVTLLKHNENARPLPGVTFALTKQDGTVIRTAITDADGIVTFERIPYGEYTIVETQGIPGYIMDSTKVNLKVDGHFVNPSAPLAIIRNIPNKAWLLKVDQDGKPLAGAVFGLYDTDHKMVMTAVSDAAGKVTFMKIPDGVYTISEIEAPKGYLLSRQVIDLKIDKDYRNSNQPLATIRNLPKRVRYIKIDTSGKAMVGVRFALIDATSGEIIEVVSSDEYGEFVFTKIDYGHWIIREIEAPDGFNRMDDLILHIDENWTEPEPFTCINIPNHYEFVKTDNEGNPIAGVKFTIEDADGHVFRDLVSDDDGIVHVTDLKPGRYTIREIETLDGFTRTEETIQFTIDEHYIVPPEMYRLVNYPAIQTGVDLTMMPVMYIGAGLLLLAAILRVINVVIRHNTMRKRKKK